MISFIPPATCSSLHHSQCAENLLYSIFCTAYFLSEAWRLLRPSSEAEAFYACYTASHNFAASFCAYPPVHSYSMQRERGYGWAKHARIMHMTALVKSENKWRIGNI